MVAVAAAAMAAAGAAAAGKGALAEAVAAGACKKQGRVDDVARVTRSARRRVHARRPSASTSQARMHLACMVRRQQLALESIIAHRLTHTWARVVLWAASAAAAAMVVAAMEAA